MKQTDDGEVEKKRGGEREEARWQQTLIDGTDDIKQAVLLGHSSYSRPQIFACNWRHFKQYHMESTITFKSNL